LLRFLPGKVRHSAYRIIHAVVHGADVGLGMFVLTEEVGKDTHILFVDELARSVSVNCLLYYNPIWSRIGILATI